MNPEARAAMQRAFDGHLPEDDRTRITWEEAALHGDIFMDEEGYYLNPAVVTVHHSEPCDSYTVNGEKAYLTKLRGLSAATGERTGQRMPDVAAPAWIDEVHVWNRQNGKTQLARQIFESQVGPELHGGAEIEEC